MPVVEEKSSTPQILYSAGLAMLAVACVLLVYLALFMLRLIHDPRDLALAAFVAERFNIGAQVVSGTVEGRSFYLRLDPALLGGLYCIVSLAMITTCAAILRGLASLGLKLVRDGRAHRTEAARLVKEQPSC